MADKVLLKQNQNNLHRNNKVDIFAHKTAAYEHASFIEKVVNAPTTAISDSSFGSTLRFNVPKEKIICCYLVADIGTSPTNGFYDEIGLSLVDNLRIKCGGNTISECNNNAAILDAIQRMPYSKQTKLRVLMGNTSFSTGQFVVPLALPFDKLTHPDARPFDARGATVSFQIECTLRAISALTNSNTATDIYNSLKMHTIYIVDDSPVPDSFSYQCLDYQTLTGNSVPDSTDTDIDLTSLTGDIVELSFADHLTSNLSNTVADYGAPQNDIEKIRIKVDGKEIYNNNDDFQESQQLENLVLSHDGVGAGVFGDVTRCTFSATEPNRHVYTGAVPFHEYAKSTVTIKHSAGAACSVDVAALGYATIKFNNGKFSRVES